MGNNLRSIAQYCDCLETPWPPYQDPESDHHSQSKFTKSNKKTHDHSQPINPNPVIFDQPLRENDNELKIQYNRKQGSMQNLSDLTSETFSDKQKDRANEMDIIDLEKIDPLIRHEAKKKIKLKSHTEPLKIEERVPSELSREQKQLKQDTLSNMFEHEPNKKYFIDQDEAQIYHLDLQKEYKY